MNVTSAPRLADSPALPPRPALDLATSSAIAAHEVADADRSLDALIAGLTERPLGFSAVFDAERAVHHLEVASTAIAALPITSKTQAWLAGELAGAANTLRGEVLRPLYRIDDAQRDLLTPAERDAFLGVIAGIRRPLAHAFEFVTREA